MSDDFQLLRRYVEHASDAAFAELSRRYVDLVYSAALRQVHDRHLAEDVTQAVFLVLARKAKSIRRKTPLSAWLHTTTRYAAGDALRARARRMRIEHKAAGMTQETLQAAEMSDDWSAMSPLLDEAVAHLREKDRRAVLLRYFENKSLEQVGAELGMSADAARMRLERATQRMRDFFRRRGVHISAVALPPVLLDHATEHAPPTLKHSLPSMAAGAACSPAITSTARRAWRIMMRNKLRPVAAGILVLAAVAVTARSVGFDGPGLALVLPSSLAVFGGDSLRTPLDAYHYYARALRDGNAARMLAVIHTRSDLERRRAESAVQLHLSVARFRRACARAFGPEALDKTEFFDAGGSDLVGLVKTGYYRVPAEAPLLTSEGCVWIPLPETDVPMVQVGGPGLAPGHDQWKIDEAKSWDIGQRAMHANGFYAASNDQEELTRSVQHMRKLMDQVAERVEGGSLKSAAEAVDVLDAATHGLARRMPPRVVSMIVDVSPQ